MASGIRRSPKIQISLTPSPESHPTDYLARCLPTVYNALDNDFQEEVMY